jgi:hypothetical protein
LNDPVANLSALSRSGIQFSDEQKAVIKSMAETGRLAEAQTIILDELNRQYGGSAEAAAKADGGFTQLANSFGDLQEAIGAQLIPILRPLVDWLTQTVAKMQEAPDSFKRTAVVIGLVAGAIGPLLVIIPSLISGVRALRGAMLLLNMAMLTNPFFLAAAAIAAIGVAMYGLYSNASDAEDEVGKLRDELNGMEADEAVRYAAERIKEQEEAVKKQLEAVKALRSAANMGDATDRRIHSQSLARQEEVLANEQKKLEGFQQEAAILEGLQQNQESLKRTAEERVVVEMDTVEVLKAQMRARAEQMKMEQEFRDMMREDILSGGPVDQGARIDAMPDELSGLQDIASMMEEFESDFTVDEIAFEKFQKTERIMNGFKSVGQAVFQSLAENASNFGNQMGQAFGAMARGAEDGKERMKEATRGIINQALAAAQATIIEAMISSGKFSGPAAPIVIPALIAGGIGLVQSLFADIPAFAQGGIVSGPTVGLMGEYPGARTNPEVIAPLDKLQSMMQANTQSVVVSGRISGNDIRLSNDRTNRNAKRFLR